MRFQTENHRLYLAAERLKKIMNKILTSCAQIFIFIQLLSYGVSRWRLQVSWPVILIYKWNCCNGEKLKLRNLRSQECFDVRYGILEMVRNSPDVVCNGVLHIACPQNKRISNRLSKMACLTHRSDRNELISCGYIFGWLYVFNLTEVYLLQKSQSIQIWFFSPKSIPHEIWETV